MSTTKKTPLDRAIEAGRALIEEGESATGAAIRTRAGVAMVTAVEAARVLRHEMDQQETEPEATETPAAVTAAAAQVWRAAMEAAREELAMDRTAYLARVREAEGERDEARTELADAIQEVERLAAEVAKLSAELRKAAAGPARSRKAGAQEPAPQG